jgi:hypothetical protein
MQYNPVATKIAILQPNIGVGQGLIPSSACLLLRFHRRVFMAFKKTKFLQQVLGKNLSPSSLKSLL